MQLILIRKFRLNCFFKEEFYFVVSTNIENSEKSSKRLIKEFLILIYS